MSEAALPSWCLREPWGPVRRGSLVTSRWLQLVPSVQRETFPGLQEAVVTEGVPAGRVPGVLVFPLRTQCPAWSGGAEPGWTGSVCAVSLQSWFRKQLLSVF